LVFDSAIVSVAEALVVRGMELKLTEPAVEVDEK
jgi:hypothetical protein